MSRLIILGIDGLSYRNWSKLISTGAMPNSKRLIKESQLSCMNSSIPEVSSTAWTSISTGRNPGIHNIFGFTDIIDGTYTLAFTSSKTVKADPFWQWDNKRNNLIINVPQTYPAKPLPGVLVSGYVALDLDRSVYPPEKLSFIKNSNYSIDVDMSIVGESKEFFCKELHKVLQKRVEVLERLWDEQSWDSIFFVITGTDRLCHYMWDQWEDIGSEYHEVFINFFAEVDKVIGKILNRVKDDDVFVLLSDHGFERQESVININKILIDGGFLSLDNSERMSYSSINAKSKAFCMDPGRIYLHRVNRFPKGSISDNNAYLIIKELEKYLTSYEVNGKKIIKQIIRGKDIYHGPVAHRAPDLILLGHEGISFSGRIQNQDLIEETNITGKHKFDDAVFLIRSPESIQLPKVMNVEDVMNVIAKTGVLND